MSVAEGNGPVNALDGRCARISAATRASSRTWSWSTTRCASYRRHRGGHPRAVESHDRHTGERWLTVGVSPNIVDASFEALIDSITYKLLRAGAEAG